MASTHETQCRWMALEEELAMHEATLQTLLRRQQALDVNKARRQRQEHATNLESLKVRRETLEQARQKHSALQQEIEEALKKSQERLDRAIAASIRVDDDPNAVSAQDDGDEVTDEENDSSKEEGEVDENESLPLSDAQVQDVPIITVPQLHCNPEIMQDFWNTAAASDSGLAVFLPCLNSVDLIQRVMHVTALETLALDHAHQNHRLESLKRTILDFFSTARMRMEYGLVENVPVMMEEDNKQEEGAIDPNVALCPYELAGVCADAFCPYQHIKPRSTPNLAWELLPLPKLKLPEIPVDECTEESPRKRPRTEKDNAIEQTVDPSDERRKKRLRTEIDDASEQTVDSSDERKEKDEPSNQTDVDNASNQTAVDPCDAGTQRAECGSTGNRVVTMDWNDDFLSLPPVSKAMEEGDSVSSDESAGQVKNYAPDTASLDNERHDSLSTLWWLTDDDIARVKNFSGTLSTLQLSVTDWLELVGGFQIKQTSDGETVLVAFRGYPESPTEAISVVGRVVDCVRLAIHAGRFDLTHALCEFARKSLSNVFSVKHANDDLKGASNVGITLSRAVEYLSKERDGAFCFNSDSRATFCCAFEVQVSMAALTMFLKLLHEQQTTDDQSELCGRELDELSALFRNTIVGMHRNMVTPIAQQEATNRKKQEREHKPLELFTGDEADKETNSPPSNMIQLGQSFMTWAMAMDSSKNSLVDEILKPALSDLRLMADETYKEGQCMTALVVMGYVILGCAQSACSHVVSNGDAGVDFSATLTPIDSCIHKLIVSLANIASTQPLAELLLAPLYALSVSLASTLRRYGKAQHRLEVALNGVLATRRISGGYMVYSELLWSQLIQLQCSLPQQETTNRLANAAGHERIARLVHAFDVHPNHVTLSGDWNTLQEQVRYELCQRVFFGGKPFVCTLTHIQTPASLSVTSLAFPRSALLAGSHLSALIAKKCQLRELPATFGQHFPNMKILDLGYNCLTELPESIGELQSLHRLNVSHNNLRVLSVGSLKKLVRLYADHNELTALPNILGCKSLEELDLSHNPIQNLPSDLPLRLTNLWNLCVDEADPAVEEDPPKLQPTPETLVHIDSHRKSDLSLEADPPVEEDPPKSQPAPETLARIGCNEVNGNEGSKSQPILKGRVSKFSPAADHPVKEAPPKVLPTLETIACIECGEVKGNDGFYKNQWKLRKLGGANCKSCWNSRHHLTLELSKAADASVVQDPPKSQPAPETLACIDSRRVPPAAGAPIEEDPPKVQPVPETLACFQCGAVKGKEDFYKSQWKLREQGGANCKPCWNSRRILTLERSKAADASAEKDPPKSQPAPEMLACIDSRRVPLSLAAGPAIEEDPPKVQPVPETLACFQCGAVKGKEDFYKSQWKLREQGGANCKPCWNSRRSLTLELSKAADASAEKDSPKSQSAPETLACIDSRRVPLSLAAGPAIEEGPPKMQPVPETLACFQCGAVKGKEDFYKSQWKLREQGGARCNPCWDTIAVLASIAPVEEAKVPETLACVDCGTVKEKEGFYKNQWKLRDQGGARCKPCWDQNRVVVEASLIVESPVEKDSPKSETAPPETLARIVSGELDGKERSKLEPSAPTTLVCIECGAVKGNEGFYKSQGKLGGQGGSRCKLCWDTHEEKSHGVSELSPSSFSNALAQLIADNPVIEVVPPKVQPAPETLACIDCSLVKGKDGFYKNQWKLRLQGGAARCKPCWDIHRVSELLTPPTKKQPSDDDSNMKSGDPPPQMKPLEPLETLACIDCDGTKGKDGFYKSQWKLREQGGARCRPCWDSHLVSEQGSNPKADTPVEAQPILEILGCLDCGAVKDKDGFYKGQWKLRERGGARCKSCWDIYIGHVKQTKMTEAVEDPLLL